MGDSQKSRKGRTVLRAAFLFVTIFGAAVGAALIWHPDSPLPGGWNPIEPLRIADAPTPLTGWKLDRAAADPALCLATLEQHAKFFASDTIRHANPDCGIATPVSLIAVGRARVTEQTNCPTALRLAMWEAHGLQPAAEAIFGTHVAGIRDSGSYNCRPIRGSAARMSTHATAMAIDVSGFDFADGRRVTLLRDWDGVDEVAAFLRAAQASACKWFVTVLGPNYNVLHADHFHLQATGWGTCR